MFGPDKGSSSMRHNYRVVWKQVYKPLMIIYLAVSYRHALRYWLCMRTQKALVIHRYNVHFRSKYCAKAFQDTI